MPALVDQDFVTFAGNGEPLTAIWIQFEFPNSCKQSRSSFAAACRPSDPFQAVDGRILTGHIIANFGIGNHLAHCGSGLRDGIAA